MHNMRPSVEALVEPYNRIQDHYQAYYRTSLAAYCAPCGIPFRETGSRFLAPLRLLYTIRESNQYKRILPGAAGQRVIDTMARMLGARRGPQHSSGKYIFHLETGDVRVVIDAGDTGRIARPEFLEWSDLYFKTNYWPTREYPPKVRPMANLNPLVLPHINDLQEVRNADKEWDLFGFFRVWGGKNELEGVEHNLALFETLARIRCKKKLLAFLVVGDTTAAAKRLEKAGVPYTTTWIPRAEVWRIAARSRLNIVRHGMHECIPWRMTETLAMGGCPVLDYESTTRWHVPLEENVHYLNLGVPYQPSSAPQFDRDAVAARVEEWLARADLVRDISRNTAGYFDQHLKPERLGEYIWSSSRVLNRSVGLGDGSI